VLGVIPFDDVGGRGKEAWPRSMAAEEEEDDVGLGALVAPVRAVLDTLEEEEITEKRRHRGNNDCWHRSLEATSRRNLKWAMRWTNYKTRICNQYAEGQCEKGDSCTFAHGVGELR